MHKYAKTQHHKNTNTQIHPSLDQYKCGIGGCSEYSWSTWPVLGEQDKPVWLIHSHRSELNRPTAFENFCLPKSFGPKCQKKTFEVLSSNPGLDHLTSVSCESWPTSFQSLAPLWPKTDCRLLMASIDLPKLFWIDPSEKLKQQWTCWGQTRISSLTGFRQSQRNLFTQKMLQSVKMWLAPGLGRRISKLSSCCLSSSTSSSFSSSSSSSLLLLLLLLFPLLSSSWQDVLYSYWPRFIPGGEERRSSGLIPLDWI